MNKWEKIYQKIVPKINSVIIQNSSNLLNNLKKSSNVKEKNLMIYKPLKLLDSRLLLKLD
jgi:hypothetical protein